MDGWLVLFLAALAGFFILRIYERITELENKINIYKHDEDEDQDEHGELRPGEFIIPRVAKVQVLLYKNGFCASINPRDKFIMNIAQFVEIPSIGGIQ